MRQTAKGPVSLQEQQFTVLEYQMSSPHCPDRTTNAHAGTSECGHLREFNITVREREKKSKNRNLQQI
jgi:hypothetical protein